MTTDTSVLVITSLEDVTADLVIASLNERRVPVTRIDPDDLGAGFTFAAAIGGSDAGWQGHLTTPSRIVDLSRIRSLYYRRPSPWRFEHLAPQEAGFAANEARYGLGGLLRSITGCRYVNHPAAIAGAITSPLNSRSPLNSALPCHRR